MRHNVKREMDLDARRDQVKRSKKRSELVYVQDYEMPGKREAGEVPQLYIL